MRHYTDKKHIIKQAGRKKMPKLVIRITPDNTWVSMTGHNDLTVQDVTNILPAMADEVIEKNADDRETLGKLLEMFKEKVRQIEEMMGGEWKWKRRSRSRAREKT